MSLKSSNSYIVYRHTSPSGKVYIGITSYKAEIRWNNGKGYIGSKKFQRAITKYGWSNIKHEVLLNNISKEEALYAEKYLIKWYKIHNISYNITDGGDGVVGIKGKESYYYSKHLSLTHRKHISEAKSGIATKTSPVIQMDLKGNFIAEYESITIAARATGSDGSKISKCCYNIRHKTNNYKWKFKDENKNIKSS